MEVEEAKGLSRSPILVVAGVSGALRPNPRIIPGMWFNGLNVFPKFFIDSSGVELELGVKMEPPVLGLGVA